MIPANRHAHAAAKLMSMPCLVERNHDGHRTTDASNGLGSSLSQSQVHHLDELFLHVNWATVT